MDPRKPALALLALLSLLVLLQGLPARAESLPAPSAPPRGGAPSAGLGLGCLIGLDRPARGAELELRLEAGGDLAPGAGLRLAWDAGLGAWFLTPLLLLRLGPDLALFAGGELVLGAEPRAGTGVSAGGGEALARLRPAPWPNRFGLRASLATFRPSSPGAGPAPRRTWRSGLEAELGWSAYAIAGIECPGGGAAPPLAEVFAGASGFAVGFRARIALVLSPGPRR